MYHILYVTTNKVNQKIYVGIHSTENLNDGYIGSGTLLLKSIKKYGKENFKTEILCFCESREESLWVESLIVDSSFLMREDTYNLGMGGGKALSKRKLSNEHKEKISFSQKGKQLTEKHIENIRKARKGTNPAHLNSMEVKQKIAITNMKRYGSINPFSNESVKEKIYKTNMDKYGGKGPMSSPEVKQRLKEKMELKYGAFPISKVLKKIVRFENEIMSVYKLSIKLDMKYPLIAYNAQNKKNGFEYFYFEEDKNDLFYDFELN